MNQLTIDALELATTTVYAFLLEQHKWRWEPEWTVVEVGIGSAICLRYAELRNQSRSQHLRTDATYRADVWRSFFVGGMPIVIWQLQRANAIRINGLRTRLNYFVQRLGASDVEST